jgi:hypothetical protein
MKKLFSVLAVSMVLAGCGGSDGGSSGVPEARPSGTVSGTAFDGLILNGDVKVYAWNGSKGELLGQGSTDGAGEYSVELDQVPSQPVLIEVTSGRYEEEASGKSVPLRVGDFLYALKNYQQGDSISTSLTFYTTIATGLAEYMTRTGVDVNDAVARANDTVSEMIGIDIRDVTPLEIVDKANATPVVTDQHLYGFATASISQLTAWISEQNNDDVHKEYSSIKFAAAAYQDIASDGQLDGKDQGRIIAQGTVRLTPDVYRSDIARNMLVMANSDVNVTGLTPTDILPMAQQYNQSNSALFAGAEIRPLEALSPVITNLSHSSNEVIAGVVELSANITDTVGLEEVSLYIDGTLHEFQGAESAPVFTVDTSTLDDGAHEFELYTKNITGGETTETLSLLVSNAGTTISEVYPEDQSTLTGEQTFSAKVADPIGIDAVSFILDGAIYPLTAGSSPSKKFNLNHMQEGAHTLIVEVTNSVGTKSQHQISFSVDNTPPAISWNLDDKDVLSGTVDITADITDNDTVSEAELFINGSLLNEFTSFPVALTVNTRAYTEGVKTIVLEARDEAGNTTTVQRELLFDSTPPTVAIQNPVAGSTQIANFEFVGSIYEAVGIDSAQLFINGNHHQNLTVEQDGTVRASIKAADFENGNYTVKIVVVDNAGYQAQAAATVGFYAQAPKLNITESNTRVVGNRQYESRFAFEVTNSGPNAPYYIHSATGSGEIYVGQSSNKTFSFTRACEQSARRGMTFVIRDSNGLKSAPLQAPTLRCF